MLYHVHKTLLLLFLAFIMADRGTGSKSQPGPEVHHIQERRMRAAQSMKEMKTTLNWREKILKMILEKCHQSF